MNKLCILVHLKKIEYNEKGQFFCHSFQKVKPIFYIDSLHIIKYFKPLFLEILKLFFEYNLFCYTFRNCGLQIMTTQSCNPKIRILHKINIK